MARFFWYVMMAALAAALVSGASWAGAYYRVGTLLGSPPPKMGTQSTTFLRDGLKSVRGRPKVWRFAFGPTEIPGAPKVRIYVSPSGELVATDPPDLQDHLRQFRSRGY